MLIFKIIRKIVPAILVLSQICLGQNADYFDLAGSWHFKIDPQNTGLVEKWFLPAFDDSRWEQMPVPGFWESRDEYAGYDGTAWYRHRVVVPESFLGKQIYLGLGGIDDEFDLWIDGKHFGHFGEKETGFTYYQRKSVHNVTDWLPPGSHMLTFRVVDWAGGGGIHRGPVALASDTTYFMTKNERLMATAQKYPDALWPYWVQGHGRAWTVIGLEDAVSEGMVSWDGALGAKDWPFSLSVWLRTADGKVYAAEKFDPSQIQWSLPDGFLPFPVLKFGNDKIQIEQHFAVLPDKNRNYPEGIARIDYKTNSSLKQPIEGKLYLAIRPYQVQGRVGDIDNIKWNDTLQAVKIDGNSAVWCSAGKPVEVMQQPVSLLNFSNSPGDVSLYSVLKSDPNEVPNRRDNDLKMNAAAVAWPVEIQPGATAFTLEIPLGNGNPKSGAIIPAPQSVSFDNFAAQWKSRLQKVTIQIPDKQVTDAYYASLAYILINADQKMPHPGPWAYDLFWYRDTAYILAALLRNGYFDFTRETIAHLMNAQRPSGEFPPIFDLNYKQVGQREWDSQGQGIFALTEYVRFTGDTALVKTYWSNVQDAVRFLDSLQASQPDHILPKSWSAEDLGSVDWHHYWDDFWAVRGLQDAAWLADRLGKEQESAELIKKAETLSRNAMVSIRKVMEEKSINWIPNGPEDIDGSSMARGTSPGLWPGGALDADDPLVRQSFDFYWQKWIEPYDGAYLHQGKFWPYAFELATCYIFLNQPERAQIILDWHLAHQTMPGVYAWGENSDTTTLQFAAGDIPHGWVAADYINLVHHILVYASGDSLVFGAGIPWKWLENGQPVTLQHSPTYLGQVSFTEKLSAGRDKIDWDIEAGDTDAVGLVLRVPPGVRIQSVKADGRPWTDFNSRGIRVPVDVSKVIAQIEVH